ncbi:MAG: TolC family protein, partial [Gemmatimonadota bacterium]
ADLGPFQLADEPLPVFDPSSLDAGRLVQRALGANPDVLQAESGVEARRIGVSQAHNAWWPTLSFGYNIYRQAQTQESDALFDVSWDEDLDQRFYAQLTVPFFNDYFGNRRQIEQAEVDLDNSREQLRETRLQTEERVRTELLNLQNQYETLLLNRRSLEIAEEALELAREEYRLGTLTFQELQQSVQDEADARRQVTTARFGFVGALLNLEDAVGVTVRGEPPVTDGSNDPGRGPGA